MFSKKDSAHEDSIWCVDWKRTKNDNEEEDGSSSSSNAVEVIATGGVEDLVKVSDQRPLPDLQHKNYTTRA